MNDINRRDFLKIERRRRRIAEPAWHLGTRGTQAPVHASPPIELVRIGMVGVGLQGGSHVENFLKIPGCRITAVCDIREERTSWAQKAITAAGHPAPAVYARGPRDFERLVRDRGSRSRLHGDAVGVARAGHAGRDEGRQARRHRSAGGDDDRRLLGARRSRREVSGATP